MQFLSVDVSVSPIYGEVVLPIVPLWLHNQQPIRDHVVYDMQLTTYIYMWYMHGHPYTVSVCQVIFQLPNIDSALLQEEVVWKVWPNVATVYRMSDKLHDAISML